MLTAVIGVAILALIIAFIVVFIRDPGPPPSDVALAYEAAWDGLDFEGLWTLCGDELRDGLDRPRFVTVKRSAYANQQDLGHLARSVVVEDSDEADTTTIVHTRIDLHDGGSARNEISLARRAGRWVVVGYQLRADDRSTP